MRKLIFLLVLILVSCKDAKPINKPSNLISDDKMAELIADFAVNDQMSFLNVGGNLETGSRYILKKHNVTAKQFSESYTYYVADPRKLDKIFSKAQEIVKDLDPKAEAFFEKREKELNKNMPELAR